MIFLVAAVITPNIDILHLTLYLLEYMLVMEGLLISFTLSDVVRDGECIN